MAPIHNRMPAILPHGRVAFWLDHANTDTAGLKALLRPLGRDAMRAWPVGKRVGNVRNDDAGLIERV